MKTLELKIIHCGKPSVSSLSALEAKSFYETLWEKVKELKAEQLREQTDEQEKSVLPFAGQG